VAGLVEALALYTLVAVAVAVDLAAMAAQAVKGWWFLFMMHVYPISLL
jgi:hypothetical protein